MLEAITDGDRVLQLKDDYPRAYEVRGTAHSQLGQYHLALNDCAKALEFDPRRTMWKRPEPWRS